MMTTRRLGRWRDGTHSNDQLVVQKRKEMGPHAWMMMMMMMTRRLVGWRDGMRRNRRRKERGRKNDDNNDDDDIGSSTSCTVNEEWYLL
jgi:hypothetical protein